LLSPPVNLLKSNDKPGGPFYGRSATSGRALLECRRWLHRLGFMSTGPAKESLTMQFLPIPDGPVEMRNFTNPRGALSFGEAGTDLPFAPLRYFIVYDVPVNEVRGTHAHRSCHQFLIALCGAVEVGLDDGAVRRRFRLDRPSLGLFAPAGTWGEQVYLEKGSRLLVLASERYDPGDYISDYDEFLKFRKVCS
jgi:hypothetical protein